MTSPLTRALGKVLRSTLRRTRRLTTTIVLQKTPPKLVLRPSSRLSTREQRLLYVPVTYSKMLSTKYRISTLMYSSYFLMVSLILQTTLSTRPLTTLTTFFTKKSRPATLQVMQQLKKVTEALVS